MSFTSLSDKTWDNLGVLFGFIACTAIGRQILHEWRLQEPSSVSLWFVVGFFFVYSFWFLYGLRFSRRGIWLPNAIAAALQIVFALMIAAKA
jgi:uncharacterized protein with PQ loop repeat